MEHDCCKFVSKCHKCQVHGEFIQVLLDELDAICSPWTLVASGMDIISPIELATFNGHILNFVFHCLLYQVGGSNFVLVGDKKISRWFCSQQFDI